MYHSRKFQPTVHQHGQRVTESSWGTLLVCFLFSRLRAVFPLAITLTSITLHSHFDSCFSYLISGVILFWTYGIFGFGFGGGMVNKVRHCCISIRARMLIFGMCWAQVFHNVAIYPEALIPKFKEQKSKYSILNIDPVYSAHISLSLGWIA